MYLFLVFSFFIGVCLAGLFGRLLGSWGASIVLIGCLFFSLFAFPTVDFSSPIYWENDAVVAYHLGFQNTVPITMEGTALFYVFIILNLGIGFAIPWSFMANAQPGNGNNPPTAPNNPPAAPGGGGAGVNPGVANPGVANPGGAGAQGAGGASVGTDHTDNESDNESDDTTAYPASSQESHYLPSSQESSTSP